MFESEGKKQLKMKHNKLQMIGASTGRNLKFSAGVEPGSGSVYGELKLSEKLDNELQTVKDHVDRLNERLEETLYEKENLQMELDQYQKIVLDKEKEIQSCKENIN